MRRDAGVPQQSGQVQAMPPDHLTLPSAAGWSLWRTLECRTAGFPAAAVLRFADGACAEAADRCNRARDEADALWDAARVAVKARIRQLLEQVRALAQSDQAGSPLQEEIRQLRRVVKFVDRRIVDDLLAVQYSAAEMAALHGANAGLESAYACFDRSFAQAVLHTAAAAARTAAEDRFREAVTWQNPKLVRTVLDCFASAPALSGARLRRNEELVANYLQRYCTKNDTIGFFGPVAWATVLPGPSTIAVRPAPRLLAKRTVYFEDWAVRAVADRLSADDRLRAWFTPRKMPFLRLDGTLLHLPGGSVLTLTAEDAAVLRACDGTCTAAQIAASLAMHPFLCFDSEQDVYDRIARLAREHRVASGFVVRVGDAWAERHLREQLLAIDDAVLRADALARLDALERARQAVAAAAGHVQALDRAAAELNAVFESTTGVDATRRAGETYGARTVVYEDCERALEVAVGTGLIAELQAPLDLVLTSARWFCHQVGHAFRAAFHDVYRRASADAGAEVGLAAFWLHAQSLFFGSEILDTEAIRDTLVEKWARVLTLPPGTAAVQRHSSELAARVQAEFAAPDCGWRAACHQSPDVMLAARGVDAIERGDYQFVLGEVHLGMNTLINHSALNQSPDPQALLSALRRDRGMPRLLPLLSRDGTQQPIRVQTVAEVGHDIEVCFSHDARPLDPHGALDIADLVVTAGDGGLMVCSRDGTRRFDLMDVFGAFLSGYAADKFRIVRPALAVPRVTIDRMVVQRQTWRFACGGLPFLQSADDRQAFLDVRRWRLAASMPVRVFVKLPWEKKPFYLDFDSVVHVRMLVKQVRGALERGTTADTLISLSEMLPEHEQVWLPDSDGNRYTSELRIVAVHQDDLARHDRERQRNR